jgi:hypothetical protein
MQQLGNHSIKVAGVETMVDIATGPNNAKLWRLVAAYVNLERHEWVNTCN